MNRFLKLFLGFCIVLLLSGCGDISIDCKGEEVDYKEEYDINATSLSTAKAKFDNKGNIKEYEFKTIETAKDEETYITRKEITESLYSETEDENYKVLYDDKKMTITSITSMEIKESDLTEEEKNEFNVSNYIKYLENSGYSCDIKGTTREKLGLK